MSELQPKDFVELLSNIYKPKHSNVDSSQYRYVIYVRKSTAGEEKQVRSLSDQILECKEMAARLNLKIVKVISESESAKEPDIRPQFKQMLRDFEKGEFDGVLAWHPDRLARNMRDAGEIIDLLDKLIIKDLKFVSYSFVNDTSGKMMLGISFVLSKQYSDKLSDDVLRGNKRSIAEGKYLGRIKHGYYKDRNQFLRPDGENFSLIKMAFQMRLAGKTLEVITQYLNDHNYSRRYNETSHKTYKIDIKRVGDFLKDPSYTGALVFGNEIKDLTEAYDFIPAVSVTDFLTINKLTLSKAFKLSRKFYAPEKIKADLMRGMVICEACGDAMSAGLTSKKTKDGKRKYFYFRCETIDCGCYNKSVRAKILIDSICDYLSNHNFASPDAYNHYVPEMKSVFMEREANLLKQCEIFKAKRRQLENRLQGIKNLLTEEPTQSNDQNELNTKVKDSFKSDLVKVEQEIKVCDSKILDTKLILENSKQAILDYPVFLELFSKLPVIIRQTKKMVDLDLIIKKIFSNFTIKDGKVAKITLNQPFDRLVKSANLSSGGLNGTRTRDLSRDRGAL
jgi:DNA invertase Pin-like site-specific DNA recombinase